MTTAIQNPAYVLGHSSDELDRLERQGSFLAAPTRSLFFRAGLRPGMRVLDFGCGVGDVSFLAADLVGPAGEVVGFDRAADAVEIARARAAHKRLGNVHFHACDEHRLDAQLDGRPFDALVGRLVLIHQKDAAATLASLARFVRPGGIVAFHEIDIEAGHWSSHPNALLAQLWRWIDGLLQHQIFPTSLSRPIHDAFDRIGVEDRIVMREGRIVRADDAAANAWIAGFARTIAHPVERLGIASESDAPIDVLLDRVTSGEHARASFNIPVYMVGATGTIPGGAATAE